jgi:hypothetical protein
MVVLEDRKAYKCVWCTKKQRGKRRRVIVLPWENDRIEYLIFIPSPANVLKRRASRLSPICSKAVKQRNHSKHGSKIW